MPASRYEIRDLIAFSEEAVESIIPEDVSQAKREAARLKRYRLNRVIDFLRELEFEVGTLVTTEEILERVRNSG